jgi:hypothetical protein
VHTFELVEKVVVAVLQWRDVVVEGRNVLPVGDIKQLENVSNIIFLIQSLSVRVEESLQNVTHFSQVFGKLLR